MDPAALGRVFPLDQRLVDQVAKWPLSNQDCCGPDDPETPPMPNESPVPVEARVPSDDTLVLVWSDGSESRYALDALRAACPCAVCVDEWTGEVRVKREMFPDVTLKNLDEVGRYAFRIAFSDGHDTGIFTYQRLRELARPVGG